MIQIKPRSRLRTRAELESELMLRSDNESSFLVPVRPVAVPVSGC